MTDQFIKKGRKNSGRVTLVDVAKYVGVGQMTVSRALRTPERVSAPLRQKIEHAVQTLGYVPNSAARQLASASSQTIVIITASIIFTENALILAALRKSLAKLNTHLLVLVASEKPWLNELIHHSPLAIVLLNLNCPPEAVAWIKQSGIPTLEIGAKQKAPLHINIGIDNKLAMKMMIDFLVDKGYQEIGLLSATQDLAIFKQYLTAWRTTLLTQHISPHLILHSEEENSFSVGTKLFSDALLMWGKIDALVCLSDEIACGALYEAHRRHIRVPQDIAIVSLGGLDVGSVSYPRLTTIEIPYEKIGTLAGQRLIDLLQQDQQVEAEFIDVPIKLIKRDSA